MLEYKHPLCPLTCLNIVITIIIVSLDCKEKPPFAIDDK